MRPARIRSAKLQKTMPPTLRAVRSALADEQSRARTAATGSPNGSNAVGSVVQEDAVADEVRIDRYVAPDRFRRNGRDFPLFGGKERVVLSKSSAAVIFFFDRESSRQ